MIRYLILNLAWVAIAWIAAKRLKLESEPTALVVSLIILYLMMVIFNTYLTSLPIVEYNSAYILGAKILTWPIEDVGYLLVAIFLAPGLYTAFLQHYESNQDIATPAKTPTTRRHTKSQRSRRHTRNTRR